MNINCDNMTAKKSTTCRVEKPTCTLATQTTDGINIGLGVISLAILGYLYQSSETNYPGTGLQSLIYGSAIIGGIALVGQLPLSVYKYSSCNLS